MRVLMLCTSGGHGGLELYAAEEVRKLLARDFECLPVVKAGSMLDKRLQENRISSVHLSVSNHRLPFVAARRLARLIDDKKIDLVHIHWNDDLNLAALAKKFSRQRPRLVYSRHMAITRSKKDPLHRWVYREVDHLIVITRCMQQEAKQYLPVAADKITPLYLGVAEVDETPAPEQSCYDESFPRRKLNLALFGRIEHYKGQHLLIQALEKLIAEEKNVSVTIIGHVMDEKYYSGLRQQVRERELGDYVRFESFVSQPAQRMKCYDAIVLTTYCETFGLVLVEAMRAGVAVIGTRCGGVPEIVSDQDTGLLFRPGDSDDLARCITYLYQHPDKMTKMAQAGRARAADKFAENKHFDNLEKILLDVAG